MGNPDAIFVFQILSTLTTDSDSVVNVLNGTDSTGVYWQVGSSATLGTNSLFAGNIVALTSITLDTGARIQCGRAVALNGSVTMNNNVVSNDCDGFDDGSSRSDFSSAGFSGDITQPGAVPVPAALWLFGSGLIGLSRGKS